MPDPIRDLEARLAIAHRCIVRGRRIIGRQFEQVNALRRDGHPTAMADEMFAVFRMTLKAFEDLGRQLLEHADEAVSANSKTGPLRLDSVVDRERSPVRL